MCRHEDHATCDAHVATADHGMVATPREGSEHASPLCCSLSRRAPTARSMAARRDASRAGSNGVKSEQSRCPEAA
eukprot:1549098-Pleurochrysis_carterae.AAC.1